MPPSYIRVRAVVWAYGRGQTDRDTDARNHTTKHFASSTTHAKCNNSGNVDGHVSEWWTEMCSVALYTASVAAATADTGCASAH